MNRFIFIFLATLLIVGSGFAQAQTATVTGTVTDSEGPLLGVTVAVKGTTNGTITDMDGKFSIKVANTKDAVLQFSFVGMNTVDERLNGRTSGIDVVMIEQANHLEDVVVIGYGTQKKASLTGAVSMVGAPELEKVPVASVADAMVGKLPGVQITSVDGSPDADIMIRVRGGGAISDNPEASKPLLLLDGFQIERLNDVPPTDIESITVLKDAASTAIYGARGANGVILITTKSPKEGRLSVSLNTYLQVKTLSKKMDVMDPYEYTMMQYEYARNRSSDTWSFNNKYGQPYELYVYQGEKGVDWQDELFGSNPVASFVDLNINGGSKNAKYKFSLVHQDQPGVLIENGMQQTNANIRVDLNLTDRLTLEYRSRFSNQTVKGAGTEGVSLLTAMRTAPTEGLDDFMDLPEDNSYIDPDEYTKVIRFNPQEQAEKNFQRRNTRTFNNAFALSWEVINGLRLRSEFGFQYSDQEKKRFWGTDTGTALANNNQPVTEWSMKRSPRWQLTNTANYNFQWNKIHDIQLMLGQELTHNQSETKTFRARYFPAEIKAEKAFDNLSLGTPFENSSYTSTPDRTTSFFGRANYELSGKYMATVAFRLDGSSKFSKENQWGVFPAAAVAWRISKEDFMSDLKSISNLKIRASYGSSGFDGIDANQSQKYWSVSRSKSIGWGDESHYYYSLPQYLPNPSIKWATTITRNLGIDFGFFREKLHGTLDYYSNTVKDLLVYTRVPTVSGYERMASNMGQTSNQGIELQLNAYLKETAVI